jgi:hypothetical protein
MQVVYCRVPTLCRGREELEPTAAVKWVEDGWWLLNYPEDMCDLVAIVQYCPWCGCPLGGEPTE